MEPRAYAIATGLFVLLMAVLLLVGAFWLAGDTLRGVPYDLVTEASVAGLSTGAPVRLRGVEVGQIRGIGFDPSDPRHVRARALVDPKVRVMEGTYATLSYLGLSGTAYVELDYPDSAVHTLVTSPVAPARIPMQPSGLAQLTDSGEQFLKTFTSTLQHVDAVLTPQTSRNLSQLIAQLNHAAADVTTLMRDLQPAARRLNIVIRDADDMVQSTRTTVRDVDSLIIGANDSGGALAAVRDGARGTGQAVQDLERALVYETLPRIDVLAEHLSRASDSLDQLLQQLQAQPQSIVFGRAQPPPGPGEPGFQQGPRK